ncbi:MAG: glycerate kinase [Prevotella sp.]|nr:glycerate kinase [Prevotella sp.]
MGKIIVAIDSFKGCLTSAEANRAAVEGILARMPEAEVLSIPVSDGGEGWLEAFRSPTPSPVGRGTSPTSALTSREGSPTPTLPSREGALVEVDVRDPLMRHIIAPYLVMGDTAVIEIAKASGLTLLNEEERNPMIATSYGTGQLVADAVRRGCRHIIVGLGGSATSDCGIGMLRAIIDNFAKHGSWDDVHELDAVHFTIATDVTNPLCGENGAAHVFAPQKGATQEVVQLLDARAKRFAEVSARHFGYDCQNEPGAGAAGGLGYAFLQYMNAERQSGIDLLLDTIGFDRLLEDATLVITGEGASDRQTLMGKVPYGILQRAKAHQVPVALIAGRIEDRQELLHAGFSQVVCINPPDLPTEEAMKPETAKRNIFDTMQLLAYS